MFGIIDEIELDAMKIGLEASVIYHCLKHWCVSNYSNKKVIENILYAECSIETIQKFIPYITREKIVEHLTLLWKQNYIDIGKLDNSDGKTFLVTTFLSCEKIEVHKDICSQTKQERKRNEGFIYILKCADKYKLGYSNNVEQRIKQLDTRPFPLELVYKAYSEKAYDIEQELHSVYTSYGYRLEGEWYSSDLPVEKLIYDVDRCIAEDDESDEAWEAFEKKYEGRRNNV